MRTPRIDREQLAHLASIKETDEAREEYRSKKPRVVGTDAEWIKSEEFWPVAPGWYLAARYGQEKPHIEYFDDSEWKDNPLSWSPPMFWRRLPEMPEETQD